MRDGTREDYDNQSDRSLNNTTSPNYGTPGQLAQVSSTTNYNTFRSQSQVAFEDSTGTAEPLKQRYIRKTNLFM